MGTFCLCSKARNLCNGLLGAATDVPCVLRCAQRCMQPQLRAQQLFWCFIGCVSDSVNEVVCFGVLYTQAIN